MNQIHNKEVAQLEILRLELNGIKEFWRKVMIQFGDDKNDEIRGVTLFRLEFWNVTLAIYRMAIYPKFEIHNGKYCFCIESPYSYLGIQRLLTEKTIEAVKKFEGIE